MPRVNLGRDPVKERQEATRRIIKRGMAEQGINRQEDIARKIGMSQPSLYGTCSWGMFPGSKTTVSIGHALRRRQSETSWMEPQEGRHIPGKQSLILTFLSRPVIKGICRKNKNAPADAEPPTGGKADGKCSTPLL